MSLEKQAAKIRVCKMCSLHKSRKLAVPGEGSPNADLMFIGEGPGAEEDIQGRPFVGAAGKYLNALFAIIGLKREDVFITNVVKCRPPRNRVPKLNECKACSNYLKAQMSIIKPKLICTLGNTALETLTGESSISNTHGRLLKKTNHLYFPLYHPAAILHNPALKPILESDVNELKVTLNKLKFYSKTKVLNTRINDFFAKDANE